MDLGRLAIPDALPIAAEQEKIAGIVLNNAIHDLFNDGKYDSWKNAVLL